MAQEYMTVEQEKEWMDALLKHDFIAYHRIKDLKSKKRVYKYKMARWRKRARDAEKLLNTATTQRNPV